MANSSIVKILVPAARVKCFLKLSCTSWKHAQSPISWTLRSFLKFSTGAKESSTIIRRNLFWDADKAFDCL